MNRLRELRLEHKERQIDLSVGVDIDTQDISRYERGLTQPKLETWKKLAEYFKVTPQYLVGWSDKK